MKPSHPYYLAGRAAMAVKSLRVQDKFSGATIAEVSLADRPTVESAIAAADDAARPMRLLRPYQRQQILQHVVQQLIERQAEFAQTMCTEAGKPIRDSRVEVTRAIDTFRIAAEESLRNCGDHQSLEISQRAAGYEGISKRVPIGPCSFITPFNFPLNLVAHKVAPAIAIGCPFVLKPAPQTPLCAIMLAEILAETDLPLGSFSILPCEIDDAAPMIEDDRIKLLSFTGSAAVGWMLKSKARKKKVVLELGGNAACIVDRDADLDTAAQRITFGAFYQSGQSCISVQRVFAHESVYGHLRDRLVAAVADLKAGDPRDESVTLGPLISEADAQRIHQWVNDAVQGGAHVVVGGRPRDRVFFEPTIVERVPHAAKLYGEEVFGPVMTIEPFSRFEDACRGANDSRYGLQAGVFTRDLRHAMYAFNELQVGGVIINDIPSVRIDSMPYGGVKDSGLGREGVRYAMQEMSEIRLMVLKNLGW